MLSWLSEGYGSDRPAVSTVVSLMRWLNTVLEIFLQHAAGAEMSPISVPERELSPAHTQLIN